MATDRSLLVVSTEPWARMVPWYQEPEPSTHWIGPIDGPGRRHRAWRAGRRSSAVDRAGCPMRALRWGRTCPRGTWNWEDYVNSSAFFTVAFSYNGEWRYRKIPSLQRFLIAESDLLLNAFPLAWYALDTDRRSLARVERIHMIFDFAPLLTHGMFRVRSACLVMCLLRYVACV